MVRVWLVLRWIFAAFLSLMSIGAYASSGAVSALFVLTGGILTSPPVGDRIGRLIPFFKAPWRHLGIGVFCLFAGLLAEGVTRLNSSATPTSQTVAKTLPPVLTEAQIEANKKQQEVQQEKQREIKQQRIAAEKAQALEVEREEARWRKTKAGKICTKNPEWSKYACETLALGKVRIGMTRDQARVSWGRPNSVNKTTSAHGTHEQWVYDGNYLYFEDGILTTVQN